MSSASTSDSDFLKIASQLLNRITFKGYQPREEQPLLIANMLETKCKQAISLVEASTGIGKGLSLALAAVDSAEKGQRCVLAAPTLKVLSQLYNEYSNIKQAPDATILIGKQEYFSKTKALSFLSNNKTDKLSTDAAINWINDGALAHKDALFQYPYMVESLKLLVPQLNISEIYLEGADESDPGMQSYLAQFGEAEEVSIIFCTHAMLSIDVMSRIRSSYRKRPDMADKIKTKYQNVKLNESINPDYYALANTCLLEDDTLIHGMIPNGYDAVYIDEAHLFEKCMADALSHHLSLYSVKLKVVELGQVRGRKPAKLLRLLEKITILSSTRNNEQISMQSILGQTLLELSSTLESFIKSFPVKANPVYKYQLGELKSQLFVLKKALTASTTNKKHNFVSHISHTPVKKYPTISVGNKSVHQQLDYLWRSVDHAVLTSATFFLPLVEFSYIRSLLSIPDDRLYTPDPIKADWLTTDVKCFVPQFNGKDGRAWLQPPSFKLESKKFAEHEELWLDELAISIEQISKNPVGGILVLATSYHTVTALSKRLALILKDRLIVQDSKSTFSVLEKQYRALHLLNKKPVWLSTGRAWTGLDLVDKQVNAESDTIVTDLVITKIPFSTNQSLSHKTRVNRFFNNECYDSALVLRQGIGRLKRRPGEPNKNIWVLDSRLTTSRKKIQRTLRLHKQILQEYVPNELEITSYYNQLQ